MPSKLGNSRISWGKGTELFAIIAASTPHIAAAEPENDNSFEDIVVTAHRRSESMQNVPISVNVMTGAAIASSGALDTSALSGENSFA